MAMASEPPPPAITTTISSLSGDILLEIFLRLPTLPALVRAAFTCQAWLRTVRSSPSFRRLFRNLHPAPPVGFFPEPYGSAFLPTRRSDPDVTAALRGGDFFLTSLPQKDDAFPGWQVTDCRDGYILLSNPLDSVLAALNPMTWATYFLPMPPGDIKVECRGGFAFLGFHLLSSDENPWSFSVFCVCRDEWRVRAATFSSETFEWNIHPWVNIGRGRKLRFNAGTLVDGSIYWPYDEEGRMLTLNTATMDFSSVDLPFELMVQWRNFKAGQTKDGKLCLVYASDYLLHVWIPRVENDRIVRWLLQKSLSLSAKIALITGGLWSSYRALKVLEVRAGNVYLFLDEPQVPCWFFSLCLENMKLERLFQRKLDGHAYPYFMAWPPSLVGDGSFGHEVGGSQ